MAIKVNFRCIGCGVCSHVAPESFALDDTKGVSIVLNQTITDATKKAEESCPVNAISLELPQTAND